jgi:hypothetical protein
MRLPASLLMVWCIAWASSNVCSQAPCSQVSAGVHAGQGMPAQVEALTEMQRPPSSPYVGLHCVHVPLAKHLPSTQPSGHCSSGQGRAGMKHVELLRPNHNDMVSSKTVTQCDSHVMQPV